MKGQIAMTKKILFIVGDYVEDYEIMVPFQALQALGYVVEAVCPGKKAGDTIATAIHDFEGAQTYSEKPGHRFQINADFASVRADEYVGLVVPGGRSPEYLRLNAQVLALVQAFSDKPIAAICHGPQLLATANVIDGRRISAYPACRPDIEAAGATYADIGMDEGLTDGLIVSGPAWTAHGAWLKQFLAVLGATVTI
jgi:protease I